MSPLRSAQTSVLYLLFLLTAVAVPVAASDDDSRRFEFDGSFRLRYETLDGQFRAGGAGGDQILLARSRVHGRANLGRVTFNLEALDVRGYLDDAGTPLSTALIDPVDVLQANAAISVDFRNAEESVITLGRQTIDIGSRRFVGRNRYRMTINTFTGARWATRWGSGRELNLFHVSPVRREPFDRQGLDANRIDGDEELWGRRFWGVHYRHSPLMDRLHVEGFVYGYHEQDRGDAPSADRHYVWPGFRLHAPPAPGEIDGDLEAAHRWGTRHATAAPGDTTDLDVSAFMYHAELGYTFDHPWRPRLALESDHASGDRNPNDGDVEQWDRLFGPIRRDLGATSLLAVLDWVNLHASGIRFDIAPSSRLQAGFFYKWAWLDSATDVWRPAGVQDATGNSGTRLGQLFDGRARYWVVPDTLSAELGAAYFQAEEFAKVAPGATGEDTFYLYLDVIARF